MKTITAPTVKVNFTLLLITIGTSILFLLSVYRALHTTGRTQSGWGVIFFVSMAMMTIIIRHTDSKPRGWLPIVLIALCLLLASIFSVHYFAGDEGIERLAKLLY